MLLEYLKEVKDVRDGHGRRYELEYILLFAILSIAKGYKDIARFIKEKFEELTDYYGKVLRGSFDNIDNQKALNLLSTFSIN